MTAEGPEADWYADPAGSTGERWWDGQVWTTRMKPIPNKDIKTGRPSTPSTAPEQIETITADWYDDPDGSGGERYWDGERWTKQRRPIAETTTDAFRSPSEAPPSVRAEPLPYAQIRPPAAQRPEATSGGHRQPVPTGPVPFWKRSDPVRVVAAAMGVALVAVVGVVLVTQLFGHSHSWQSGYDAGSSDPASTQTIINDGGENPAGLCHNLHTLARTSSEASNVDGTDFLSGCREGVEDALKIVSPPPPTPQTVYIPVPAQTNPYPRGVVCDPLGRWDREFELGKP
jgi:hypothetical protein